MKPAQSRLVCLLLLATTWCIAGGQSQSQPKKAGVEEEQIEPQPLAPPPATAAEKAIRDKIGAYFGTGGQGPPLDSDEWPFGMPGPSTFVDYTPGPALPFAMASAVILGHAVSTQPYLSENRRAIYTELAVQVEEVFKVGSGLNTQKGDELLLVERGGSVRLANGRVVAQPVHGGGTPLRRGGRYVLFLTSTATLPRFFVYGA
jgi:hypothetical protein